MHAYGYIVLTIITNALKRTVARRLETRDEGLVGAILAATTGQYVPEGYRLCPDCAGRPESFCDRCLNAGLLPA